VGSLQAVIREVTTANISSDLSRGEGISEDQLFALRDDRDAVIDRLKNLNPGRRSVVIAFDNVGYESFAVLWQAYFYFGWASKSRCFGKANPMFAERRDR